MIVEETHWSEQEMMQKQQNWDAYDIFGSSESDNDEPPPEADL